MKFSSNAPDRQGRSEVLIHGLNQRQASVSWRSHPKNRIVLE
jgi:hypothetical protein